MKKIFLVLLVLFNLSYGDMNVTKELKSGWNLISFPISSEVSVSGLFGDELNGAVLWKYDADDLWQIGILECSNGCSVVNPYDNTLGTFSKLNPMDGFWINVQKDMNITFDGLNLTLKIDVYDYNSSILNNEQKYALAYM